jgi:probable F420-dependent oxidoreductase
MQIGALIPLTDIGADPATVREFAQSMEAMGYDFIEAPDHVLGVNAAARPDWEAGRNTSADLFHDPFVLFGFLAGCTTKLGFSTGVLILPQRQTALVAKQAAEVDLLTGGRFRLGVGLGWNAVEYEALDKDFTNRGRRLSEQVELLRQLWTETSVTFEGTYERVVAAGLAPMPVQRPIPVWFGGQSPRAYARIGQLADGWFPQVPPGPRLEEARAIVDEAAAQAGRDPSALGMEGRVSWGEGGAERLAEHAVRWREAGATHLSVNTMRAGLGGVDGHLEALAEAAGALGLGP